MAARKRRVVSAGAARAPAKPSREGTELLGTEDWLRAARDALIKHGILAVKVHSLANLMGVTRGSFYWHFQSHGELLDQLLKSWMATNTEPFTRIRDSGQDGRAKFEAISDLWVSEKEYDPKFDAAVREWARVSVHVARVVRRADDARIAVLESIFLELGYVGADAMVRARIAYFHQVGYYTLGLVESAATRRKLQPIYTRALLGEPPI